MDGFDDVRVHFLQDEDEDEPPRRTPGRRRWVLAAAAAVALLGSGTAGAAGEDAATKQRPAVSRNADGVPFVRDGHECKAGKAGNGKRHGADRHGAASVKY
jgi:hypothetical protein